MTEQQIFTSPYVLKYVYPRSVGPVLGRFFGGLRDGRILGARTAAGRVIVPPTEYDPDTGEALAQAGGVEGGAPEVVDLVEVGRGGVVKTWAWVSHPRRFHPLQGVSPLDPTAVPAGKPFAFALIQLDGADTSLLHVVDVPGPEAMRTGMRVRARFRAERKGELLDLECFVPETAPADADTPAAPPGPPVKAIKTPVHLDYTVSAGTQLSRYLSALAERRLIGARCPACTKRYIPPRGSCPTCGVPTAEEVSVSDVGTLTTFCIISIPFENMPFPAPYAAGAILLDGADIPIFHLVRGVEVGDVRTGMRLRAVWVPDEQLGPTLENIRWFEPSGEPDAPYESFKEHI